MFDARRLLDALIAAAARIGRSAQEAQPPGTPAAQVQQRGGSPGDIGGQLAATVRQVTGQRPEQLLQSAKRMMDQNPGLAQAAALGLAGILLGKPKPGRGLSANLAKLGGLAIIGGLAYKAWQNTKAGRPLLEMGGATATGSAAPAPAPVPSTEGQAEGRPDHSFHVLGVPQESRFHPLSHTEDDVLLFLRTMVAAAAADGHMDEAERRRIVKALTEAGIDVEATRWLDREMASPADVEEIAEGVNTPEKAAQVYAAARIAIDPDTLQEREFLRQLADSLGLDQALQAQIDDTAAQMRAG